MHRQHDDDTEDRLCLNGLFDSLVQCIANLVLYPAPCKRGDKELVLDVDEMLCLIDGFEI